ncbi:MAG TPA: redoxin domain-containing protein [Blastocatellia bacterium]
MRKTILLLACGFTLALFPFAHTAPAFAQRYPRHQHPHRRPAQPPAPQPQAQATSGPTLDDLRAKDFTVRTLDGRPVKLNSLLGEGKPVLIDFWATWCGPCRMVIPHLGEAHRKYAKDGLIVIGMDLEDPNSEGQAVRNFVQRYRMDYQNVFAPHAIYQFFSGNAVARIPFTILFGADGKLIWRLVGYSPQIGNALNSAIEKALAAAPAKSAESSAPEKPTEPIAPEAATEPVAPEKTTEPAAPEKPVEPANLETPAEPVTPAEPATPSAPEKPAEPVTPAKPVEQATPAPRSCNCNCCSPATAPEKKAEPVAPEKPAER